MPVLLLRLSKGDTKKKKITRDGKGPKGLVESNREVSRPLSLDWKRSG